MENKYGLISLLAKQKGFDEDNLTKENLTEIMNLIPDTKIDRQDIKLTSNAADDILINAALKKNGLDQQDRVEHKYGLISVLAKQKGFDEDNLTKENLSEIMSLMQEARTNTQDNKLISNIADDILINNALKNNASTLKDVLPQDRVEGQELKNILNAEGLGNIWDNISSIREKSIPVSNASSDNTPKNK